MPLTADVLRALQAAGASTDMIIAALEADQREQLDRASRAIPWNKLRELCLYRDGRICRYCGEDAGENWHCDHVIPRSRGGENILDNVVVSCRSCNTAKKDRTPGEWGVI